MMGTQSAPERLFYDFCMDNHGPDNHLLRQIDRFPDRHDPPLHIGLAPIVLLNGVRGEIARSPRADGSGRAHPWRSCAVCSRVGPSLSAAVWT